MAKRNTKPKERSCRTFTNEFKRESVQLLLDGHSASSVSEDLGIGNTSSIFRWKVEVIDEGGPVAEALDDEVQQLREDFNRCYLVDGYRI